MRNYFLPIVLDLVETSLFKVGVTYTDQVLHNLNIALLAGNEQRRTSLSDPADNLSSVPPLHSFQAAP